MPRRRLRSASRKVSFASLVPWHCSQPGATSQPCVPAGGVGRTGSGRPTTFLQPLGMPLSAGRGHARRGRDRGESRAAAWPYLLPCLLPSPGGPAPASWGSGQEEMLLRKGFVGGRG